MKTIAALLLEAFVLLYPAYAHGNPFGSGANAFDIEFVSVGNPDNPDDASGNPPSAGKVEYAYRLSKYEISRDAITMANEADGLGITLDSLSFVAGGARPEMPATGISWFEAARFVNWLNTSTGYAPAYKFRSSAFELWQPGDVGYNPANRFRNSQAFYFLPTADEWYKAAYYNPTAGVYYDYPSGNDAAPMAIASGTATDTAVWGQPFPQGPADVTLAGGQSPYGTVAQGGNVWEWEESEVDLVNDSTSSRRGVRGGSWEDVSSGLLSSIRLDANPTSERFNFGFRVASIPEPNTIMLGALAIALLALRRRYP
jgi:formylglycine-generating enzyme required for sulfatase activity